MLFERGDRSNTVANFPTRDFRFVIAVEDLTRLAMYPYRGVATLINDLRSAPGGVSIRLILPAYIDPESPQEPPSLVRDVVDVISQSPDVPSIQLSERLPDRARSWLLSGESDSTTAMRLVTFAEAAQADGVVTTSEHLIGMRYPLYQHQRIRIIPLKEFADVVEVCAHGHDIFWSATGVLRHLNQDLYYQFTHAKARRLTEWYSRIAPSLNPEEHRENIRTALLNRYPFILYSRDMVRFYELQLDYFARRGLHGRFGATLGYYITNFYLHVWGLLEQLTIIAKYQRNLAIEEADCGIHKNKTFWKVLGPVEPGLRSFVKSEPVANWIAAIADMRHAAAHRAMLLPRAMMEKTPDSSISDDEVRARLREEDPEFYDMPREFITALEPTKIEHWRLAQYRTVAENIVVVNGRSGRYIRGAVVSIDYDLEMLDGVLDAFLVALFRGGLTQPASGLAGQC